MDQQGYLRHRPASHPRLKVTTVVPDVNMRRGRYNPPRVIGPSHSDGYDHDDHYDDDGNHHGPAPASRMTSRLPVARKLESTEAAIGPSSEVAQPPPAPRPASPPKPPKIQSILIDLSHTESAAKALGMEEIQGFMDTPESTDTPHDSTAISIFQKSFEQEATAAREAAERLRPLQEKQEEQRVFAAAFTKAERGESGPVAADEEGLKALLTLKAHTDKTAHTHVHPLDVTWGASHERENDHLLRQRVRREVLFAFQNSDSGKVGHVDRAQFESFLVYTNFISSAEMADGKERRFLTNFITESFALASKLSFLELNDPLLDTPSAIWLDLCSQGDQHMDHLHRSSFTQHSALTHVHEGVTIRGALLLAEAANGLLNFKHPLLSSLIRDLRHRRMMHKDSLVHHMQQQHSSSRSRSASPQGHAHKPTMSAEQLVAKFTEKETARRFAIERKREELDRAAYAECTFTPSLRDLPRARAGDKVEISLPSDEVSSAASESKGGDGAVVTRRGVVLRIGPGGCYDVLCGEGEDEQEYTNIPHARVRRAAFGQRAIITSSSRGRGQSAEAKSSEQKEIETHCTFQPTRVSAEEPFISERTLRVLSRSAEGVRGSSSGQRSSSSSSTAVTPLRSSPAHRNLPGAQSTVVLSRAKIRSAAEPPQQLQLQQSPGRVRSASNEAAAAIRQNSIEAGPLAVAPVVVQREDKGDDTAEDVLQFLAEVCGNYIVAGGLIEEPPVVLGTPVYYFDRLNPPSFERGTCLSRLTGPPPPTAPARAPSSATLQDLTGVPFAPPMPDWAWGKGGDPNRGKAAGESAGGGGGTPFQRLTPKAEAPKGASGWSQIMEEMAAKRNGILKKKDEAPPKDKAKDSSKSKPGKLAKGAKKGRRKSTFEDVIGELEYTLAKMRGEIKEEEEGDDEGEDDDEEEAPAPSKSSSSPIKTPAKTPELRPQDPPPPKEIESTLASMGAPPGKAPLPPPLPYSWPPLPYTGTAPEPKKEEPKPLARPHTNIAYSLLHKPLHTVSEGLAGGHVMTSELPFGYFISGVSSGMVGPGQILPGGIVTAQLVKTFRRVFELRGSSSSSSGGGALQSSAVQRQSPSPPPHALSPSQRLISPSFVSFDGAAAGSPSPPSSRAHHFSFEGRPILTANATPSPTTGSYTPNSNDLSRVPSRDRHAGSSYSVNSSFAGAQDALFLTPYTGYSPDKSVGTEDSPQPTASTATSSSSKASRRSDSKLFPPSPGAVIHKLTINDLPLPPNFYSAVQRLKDANKLRAKKSELERSLSLRSYDVGGGGMPSTTIPKEPVFSIDKRLEMRYAKKCQDILKNTMSEMQQGSEESQADDPSGERGRSRSAPRRRESIIGPTSITPSGKIVPGRRESILPGSKRIIELRSRSPEHRQKKDQRILGRDARRRREGEQQAESAFKLKQHKERLHKQAMLTARMVGCDPSKRRNRHEKLLQKYHVAPEELQRQAEKDPFLRDYMQRARILERRRPTTELDLPLSMEVDEDSGEYGQLVPEMDDLYDESSTDNRRYRF